MSLPKASPQVNIGPTETVVLLMIALVIFALHVFPAPGACSNEGYTSSAPP